MRNRKIHAPKKTTTTNSGYKKRTLYSKPRKRIRLTMGRTPGTGEVPREAALQAEGGAAPLTWPAHSAEHAPGIAAKSLKKEIGGLEARGLAQYGILPGWLTDPAGAILYVMDGPCIPPAFYVPYRLP